MIQELLQYESTSGNLGFITVKTSSLHPRRIHLNSTHWRNGIWVSDNWVNNLIGSSDSGLTTFRLQLIY